MDGGMDGKDGKDGSFDAIVIGAGTGGLTAARTLSAAGRSVALIEADRPGGDCTWTGCVPSKTLLETARVAQHARASRPRGVLADVAVDAAAALRHVHATIEEIYEDESPAVLTGQGIDLIRGRARMVDRFGVEVAGRRLTAPHLVLATGATPTVPDLPGLQTRPNNPGVPYLTSATIWALTELPEHLVVLGGGPNGCEAAQTFARLGSRVTLVQSAERLLSRDEPEAGTALAAVLRREGVDVRLGADVQSVQHGPGTVRLQVADGGVVAGTTLLLAVGRSPSTAGLGLEVAGVAVGERGHVRVDRSLRSVTAPHVFAVGDCASVEGSVQYYTHTADEQGRLAAKNLLWASRRRRLGVPGLADLPGRFDPAGTPWVTFTEPEVASVGLTEAQAHARWGKAARVSVVPLDQLDRARTTGLRDGFVKLVAAPLLPARRLPAGPLLRLVGMTAVAPTGGEMLAAGALAIRARTPLARLAQTVSAYPTWSNATRVAAATFFTDYGELRSRPARPAGPAGPAGEC